MKRRLVLVLLFAGLLPVMAGDRYHHRTKPQPPRPANPADLCEVGYCVIGPDYTYCSDIRVVGCPDSGEVEALPE